jgi:hypothetical protein
MDELNMAGSSNSGEGPLGIDPVVKEAQERWNRCNEWESNARKGFLEDLKFRHGDSDNGFQWPNSIRRARDLDNKPSLTMNIVKQHNLQIVNQAKQNKSAIKIVPTGGGASAEAAEVFKGLIRKIEQHSQAQDVYSTAIEFQVDGGIGYWRIITDWASEDSFNQEIYLRRVPDPLCVFLDPDIQTKDGSDARFGFVFDLVLKEDFHKAYPKAEQLLADLTNEGADAAPPLGIPGTLQNVDADHVWIAEYYRMVTKRDRLFSFMVSGERKIVRESKLNPDLAKNLLEDSTTRWRWVYDDVVEWKLIVGEKVIDYTIWPGKFIPLIRVIGEEVVIEGVLDRKGHTRSMKDSQRMYNYNCSAQVEFVALQSKTPWIGAAKAVEEYETLWNTANNVNHSLLVYNHIDDEGNVMPPPQRQEPPSAAPAYQAGMETAFNQMMMVSGQWQNQMGMGGNERTGKAIGERQEQSDTSVYHFQDNFGSALRYTGAQLIDLIPKVYDTKRVQQVIGEDGSDWTVEVDPSQAKAFQKELDHKGQVIRRIFNPNVGQYEIAPEVGPAYGTKRRETQEAFSLVLTQNPALTNIIGDLLLGSMDFDKAQEAALRLRRMVPKQALGEGPSQDEQAMGAELDRLKTLLAEALTKNAKDGLKLVGKDQAREVQSYDAVTKRLKVASDSLPMDGTGLQQIVQQMIADALQTHLGQNFNDAQDQADGDAPAGAKPAAAAPAEEAPPVPGARKAPDGQWYVDDPKRPGKFLKVLAAGAAGNA